MYLRTYEVPFHIPETPEEREHLGRIYTAHGQFLLSGESPSDVSTPVQAASSTGGSGYEGAEGDKRLLKLLSEVHAKNARKALYFIAAETVAGRTPDSQVVRNLVGLAHGPNVPNNLGGTLTSVGFALKRLPGYSRPYSVFWGSTDRATYRMDGPVAEALVKLLDDQGNIR